MSGSRLPAIACAAALFFASAAGAAGIPLQYAPSSAFVMGGAVRIGTFQYLPADAGKTDPDQIPNTAIGNLHLDVPVATYIAQAVLKEFRLTGVDVESAGKVLSGRIVELSVDDLGDTCDWTLDVQYTVTDAQGNAVYRAEKITKETTQKFVTPVNQVIRHNIEALLGDTGFLQAIGSPAYPGNAVTPAIPDDLIDAAYVVTYSPRTALRAHGSVDIGSFAYLPAEKGGVKPNQFANTALMANEYIDEPVGTLVHDAVLQELRFAGIAVHGSGRILSGEIQDYSVTDTSNPSEWVVTIRYIVKDESGKVLYDAVKTCKPEQPQYPTRWSHQELTIDIESLIRDPAFIAAIN